MTQSELNEIRETHIVPLENIIAELRAENERLRAELARATQFTEYVTYEHGDLADLLNSIRSAISDEVENLALDLFGLELLIEEMESQHHEIVFLNQEQKKLNAELAKWRPPWDDAPEWAEELCLSLPGYFLWLDARRERWSAAELKGRPRFAKRPHSRKVVIQETVK